MCTSSIDSINYSRQVFGAFFLTQCVTMGCLQAKLRASYCDALAGLMGLGIFPTPIHQALFVVVRSGQQLAMSLTSPMTQSIHSCILHQANCRYDLQSKLSLRGTYKQLASIDGMKLCLEIVLSLRKTSLYARDLAEQDGILAPKAIPLVMF